MMYPPSIADVERAERRLKDKAMEIANTIVSELRKRGVKVKAIIKYDYKEDPKCAIILIEGREGLYDRYLLYLNEDGEVEILESKGLGYSITH